MLCQASQIIGVHRDLVGMWFAWLACICHAVSTCSSGTWMELRSLGQSKQLVRRLARQRRQLKRLSGAVLPEVWYALNREKVPFDPFVELRDSFDLPENFLSLSGSGMLHRTQVYSLLVANMIFRGWAFAPFLSLENPGRARHPLRWNDCIRAYATDQGCIFRGMQHAH